MIHLRSLLPWLLRAWPVLALVPVAATHVVALRVWPSDSVAVNKLLGMGLQVIGGVLVLCSINGNLGLFRSQSLTSIIIDWLKEFPCLRKPIFLSASLSGSSSLSSTMQATVTQAVNTLEERVAEVERKLTEIQQQLAQEVRAVNVRIERATSELGNQFAETSERVSGLSKRLAHVAVGGVKSQALGVLLAVYGAVTSVFA